MDGKFREVMCRFLMHIKPRSDFKEPCHEKSAPGEMHLSITDGGIFHRC